MNAASSRVDGVERIPDTGIVIDKFGMKKSGLFHQTCLKGSAFHPRFLAFLRSRSVIFI